MSLRQAGQRLLQHEPFVPKQQLLDQVLNDKAPELSLPQAAALMRLLQPNSTLYYDHPDSDHTFNPLDDLVRNYRYVDGWYFFTGILWTAPEQGTPLRFAYTLVLNELSLSGQKGKGADEAMESAQFIFTSVNDQQIFQPPIQIVPANAILKSQAPFMFGFPSKDFVVSSDGMSLFPLTLHAKDATNNIELNLQLNSPFGTDKPLFQGNEKGFIGGLGVGWVYYSYTQLNTLGSINYKGKNLPIQGKSWMDNQFGTVGPFPNPLYRAVFMDVPRIFGPAKQTIFGWIWISVWLDDKRSIAMATPIYGDKDGNVIQAAEADTAYANLQEADGSSHPIKKPLHLILKYSGPYVNQVNINGVDDFKIGTLVTIDLVLTAMLPDVPSKGLTPLSLPITESPALLSGTMAGVPVSGLGTLETVGAQKRSEALKILLAQSKLPVTDEAVKTLVDADWKPNQVRGWLFIISALIIFGLLLYILKKPQ